MADESHRAIGTPHDRLFQNIFVQPENAATFLRPVLPEGLVRRIDWNTLVPMPQKVVDDALGKGRMDLVFTVELSGRPAIVHLIWEHQSSVDRWQAVRSARYVVMWWEWWIAQHKDAEKLPLVLPLVLYHGRRPWSATRHLRELVDVGDIEDVGVFVPSFTYLLEDLSSQADDELRARWSASVTRLVLELFKSSSLPGFGKKATRLLSELPEWFDLHGQLQVLQVVITYVLNVSEDLTEKDLQEVERAWGPDAEGFVMTLAERLREDGLKKGLEKGRAEGRTAALINAVLDVFEERNVPVATDVRDRILACTDPEMLAKWLRRAAVANDAGQIFDV